jgi:hypothetical protein
MISLDQTVCSVLLRVTGEKTLPADKVADNQDPRLIYFSRTRLNRQHSPIVPFEVKIVAPSQAMR